MTSPSSSTFLHRVLVADAALCAVAGLAMLALGAIVAGLLGLPSRLLQGAGLALLPVALGIAWLARQGAPPRSLVLGLVALNLAWVAASLLLLASGWVRPTPLGTAFVLLQAALVAAFAALEARALGRATGDRSGGQQAGARSTAP